MESEIGKETRFDLYLPVVKGVVGKVPEHEDGPNADETVPCKGTVLSVEDEEIVRQVGCEMLEALWYEVLTATEGEESES